jgi:hypothetical protein
MDDGAGAGRGIPEYLRLGCCRGGCFWDALVSKFIGDCACGAVRYETDADPAVMLNCHCRDCQRAAGSAYAPYMIFPKAQVKVKGEPRYYRTVGDAGFAVERGICPGCGTPVMAKLERLPDLLGVFAASLDDPSLYKPALELFTTSAQPWHQANPATEKRLRGFTD